MARRESSGTGGDPTVIYYAPDGSEYPVNGETLTAVEKTNLASQGYSTQKPADPLPPPPEPTPGPLSGAVSSEESGKQ
jgi:hypothetical protein